MIVITGSKKLRTSPRPDDRTMVAATRATLIFGAFAIPFFSLYMLAG